MTQDTVSIEKVLNSRCSSSFDLGSKKNHWATFITKSPSKSIIDSIIEYCDIPRFSRGKLLNWFENEHLFLGFEKPNDPYTKHVLHIESGMQHEAVYLSCAALGIGTCIHNQGINGTEYGKKIATASHLIKEITNPYDSGKFTTKAPGLKNPFILGKNLSKPLRDGDIECLPHLTNLTTTNKFGSSATKENISQLLWAAKGRTPHCIRTHICNYLWGLTIPTWTGGQNFTTIYLLRNNKLFRYINWTKSFSLINRALMHYAKWTRGNPTHEIRYIRNSDVSSQLDFNTGIILCRNENTNRALWEVGYMLENMLLQTKSIGISYEAKIFTRGEIETLERNNISGAIATLSI